MMLNSRLTNLVAQIKKIEGVFSGTMSYIFNEFSTASPGGPSFSSVVRVAKEKGYTVRTNVFLCVLGSHPCRRNRTQEMT